MGAAALFDLMQKYHPTFSARFKKAEKNQHKEGEGKTAKLARKMHRKYIY